MNAEFFKKYLSREFLIAVALIILATVMTFKILDKDNFITVFGAWGAACIGFVGVYTAGKTKQKKAVIAANGTK
jgi:hypothetical protein